MLTKIGWVIMGSLCPTELKKDGERVRWTEIAWLLFGAVGFGNPLTRNI